MATPTDQETIAIERQVITYTSREEGVLHTTEETLGSVKEQKEQGEDGGESFYHAFMRSRQGKVGRSGIG